MPYIMIMVMTVMTLAYVNLSRAQDTHEEREVASLEGIPGVRVVIEDIEADAREDGLTKGAIHSTVEEILVSGGVRLLTQEEWSAAPSRPWLYIQVFTYKDDPHPQYVVSVRVQLLQKVALVHQPERTMTAITWEEGATVIAGKRKLKEVVRSVIKPEIEEFAGDFRFMNPK